MEGLIEGRIVHYVLNEGFNIGQHRPAIVVRVWQTLPGENFMNGNCQLQVFTDEMNDGLPGVLLKTSVLFNEAGEPNSWHWIEKV